MPNSLFSRTRGAAPGYAGFGPWVRSHSRLRGDRAVPLGSTGVLRQERFQVASCVLYLVLWWAATPVRADDALPTGHKADRYHTLWERNPFTLVTPAVQTQPQAFSKLVVVSWLNDGKDSLFVQDTDTNDVQKITDVPNEKGLRIVAVHAKGGADFQMIRDFDAVISNGSEQGTIKFKPQESGPMIASNPMNPMQMTQEGGLNPQIQSQLKGQVPGANLQPTAPSANQNGPPQTQQTRRKRVLPSAVANGTQGPVPQPQPQPQPQQNPGINQGQ
jgi:hypothetical protein